MPWVSRLFKKMKQLVNMFFLVSILVNGMSCSENKTEVSSVHSGNLPDKFIIVLGTVQDAGYPQAGCEKQCCKNYWEGREAKKYITCLGLVDRRANKYWLFEATPDIANQLKTIQGYISNSPNYFPAGIFLTHAHIGHYTGIAQFGREVMGASSINVWAMPRMDSFLTSNGPWSQLVRLKNISINKLVADSTVLLDSSFKITPFMVPHRDEYSETVGFRIESSSKKILFIPDINKWNSWDKNIVEEVKSSDLAFLDGTFYKNGEVEGRDMKEIPHPFVEETMQEFSSLPATVKSKICFIHFNHTNPLLKSKSAEEDQLRKSGFGIAKGGMIIEL